MGGRGDQVGGQDRQGGEDGEEEEKEVEMLEMQEELDKGWVISDPGKEEGEEHTSYLSFSLHRQNFWRIKSTPKNA